MTKLRIWATVTLTMAIAGLAVLIAMVLALMDISQGEANVVGEWLVVKLGFAVIFFVILATFVCTGLVLKYFRDRDAESKPKASD